MMKLHEIIISYRCIAIKRTVLKVFYSAVHGICFYHVKSNIKSKFNMSKTLWDEFESAFLNITKAYGHK